MRTNRWTIWACALAMAGSPCGPTAWSAQDPPAKPAVAPTSAEKPKEERPVPKRDEYIQKPGASRKPLADVFTTKQMSSPEPRDQVVDFNNQARGKAPVDPALVDKFAKHHAYKLTTPGAENEATREIFNQVQNANDGKGNQTVDFQRIYKSAVVKHLAEILDNSALVQINALFVMTELQDNGVNVPDAVPIFLKVLGDDKKIDGVVLMALEGVNRAKQKGLIKADEEQKAVELILARLKTPDLQSVLKEEMIKSLGLLRRPYQRIPDDALAATRIAEIAVDPNNSPKARLEAGRALAQMEVQNVPQWNSKLQAAIIAQTLKEYLDSPPLEGDANRVVERARYEALLWLDAINKGARSGGNQSDSDFQQLAKEIAANKILIPLINRQPHDAQSLEEWMAAHPMPKDHRLAPKAPEITFAKRQPTADEPKNVEPMEKPEPPGDATTSSATEPKDQAEPAEKTAPPSTP